MNPYADFLPKEEGAASSNPYARYLGDKPPKPELSLPNRIISAVGSAIDVIPELPRRAANTGQALINLTQDFPTHAMGYAANIAEGSRPLDETNWADGKAQAAEELSKQRATAPDAGDKTLLGTKGDWANTAASLPFSVGSMGGALVGGAAGSLAGGVGAPVGAALASGALAYRADSAMFVRNALSGYAQKYQQDNGRPPSQDELLVEQERLQPFAQTHGIEEAIPEGISSAIGAKVIKGVFTGSGGLGYKLAKGTAGIAAEELPSETVTQQMQHNTEIDAGVSGGEKRQWNTDDLGKSFNEVVTPVLQQSLLMGGGLAAASKVYDYATKSNSPLTRTVEHLAEVAPIAPVAEVAQPTLSLPAPSRAAAQLGFDDHSGDTVVFGDGSTSTRSERHDRLVNEFGFSPEDATRQVNQEIVSGNKKPERVTPTKPTSDTINNLYKIVIL